MVDEVDEVNEVDEVDEVDAFRATVKQAHFHLSSVTRVANSFQELPTLKVNSQRKMCFGFNLFSPSIVKQTSIGNIKITVNLFVSPQ